MARPRYYHNGYLYHRAPSPAAGCASGLVAVLLLFMVLAGGCLFGIPGLIFVFVLAFILALARCL